MKTGIIISAYSNGINFENMGSIENFFVMDFVASIFEVILVFSLTIMINTVLARIFNLKVGRTLAATILCLSMSFLLFHIACYTYLYYADPLNARGQDTLLFLLQYLETIIERISQTGISIDMEDPISAMYQITDILLSIIYGLYYKSAFIETGGLQSYLILYAIGSISNVWFPFTYSYLIIFCGYLLFMILMFWKIGDSCSCVPPAWQDVYGEEKELKNIVLSSTNLEKKEQL